LHSFLENPGFLQILGILLENQVKNLPGSYQDSTKSIGNLTKIYWQSNPKPQNLIKPHKIYWKSNQNLLGNQQTPLFLIGFPIIIVNLSKTQSFCLRQPVG
jgi:hypothetical protein